jgi:hypothetical protein
LEFVTRSHRFANEIIQENPDLEALYLEITSAIEEMSDEVLIKTFEQRGLMTHSQHEDSKNWMSLSYAINLLLDDILVAKGWSRQSPIFQGSQYRSIWTLDFSKEATVVEKGDSGSISSSKKIGFAVEVAFNHGEAIAWNLMKPVLAAEVNHLEKKLDVDSGIGILIVATKALQKAGAFDGSVGTFERVEKYLVPMRNQLTVPMVIIGLKAPRSFKLVKVKDPITRKNKGVIEKLS